MRIKILTICLLAFSAAFVIAALTACHSKPKEEEAAVLDCLKYQTESWNAVDSPKDIEKENSDVNSAALLIHNGGRAIKTDLFADVNSKGNELVAVYFTDVDGASGETYYFTNEPDGDEAALFRRVAKNQEALLSADITVNASSATGAIIKFYSWEQKKDSKVLAQLSTGLALQRLSSEVDVDEKPGSIWNVTTFTQLEKVNASKLDGYKTKIDADDPNQMIVSYGPVNKNSGGSVDVKLSGLRYSFAIEDFSVKDLSSLSGKYGSWNFYDDLGSLDFIITKPGVAVANTSGDFVVKLNHSVRLISAGLHRETYETGTIQIGQEDK